jgi:hypothetical protein
MNRARQSSSSVVKRGRFPHFQPHINAVEFSAGCSRFSVLAALWNSGYVLSSERLCTTPFVAHALYDEFVDPFSLARKSLFFWFFIRVYEN